jgi:hypothetical protein
MTGRYVALGSSMAAGPGIRPRAPGAPFRSGRSARNYAHLVAEQLNLDLVDVTFSGAATAHVLAERQRGAPPQIRALDGSEELVTITIGGNDVGYVPLLRVSALLGSIARLSPASRKHRHPGVSDDAGRRPAGRARLRPPAAGWCGPGKLAGTITAGRRTRGRWVRAGRCRGARHHFTPTRPGCAQSLT